MKTILITGGAGFIGSNLIWQLLETRPNYKVINLDKLTYAGNLRNLEGIEKRFSGRYSFVKGCITDSELVQKLVSEVDGVLHLAAESHVDRSILDPFSFLETNIKGTATLLHAVYLKNKSIRFVHVSTDEVYGALGETGFFTEDTPLAPNSPYSASKASSDFVARAYHHTYGLDVVTTRCSNNYGPFHFPEKLIPLMITNAIEGKPLPVYGTGKNVRDWIYVRDHAEGILRAFEKGKAGDVYNFGGRAERKNIDVVKAVLKLLQKDESMIRYVEDRKGHDWRYAIDCKKSEQELGWKQTVTFESGLEKTVAWYLENESWWKEVKSGEYQNFYKKYYGDLSK